MHKLKHFSLWRCAKNFYLQNAYRSVCFTHKRTLITKTVILNSKAQWSESCRQPITNQCYVTTEDITQLKLTTTRDCATSSQDRGRYSKIINYRHHYIIHLKYAWTKLLYTNSRWININGVRYSRFLLILATAKKRM